MLQYLTSRSEPEVGAVRPGSPSPFGEVVDVGKEKSGALNFYQGWLLSLSLSSMMWLATESISDVKAPFLVAARRHLGIFLAIQIRLQCDACRKLGMEGFG
jgi:hypothetical protein